MKSRRRKAHMVMLDSSGESWRCCYLPDREVFVFRQPRGAMLELPAANVVTLAQRAGRSYGRDYQPDLLPGQNGE